VWNTVRMGRAGNATFMAATERHGKQEIGKRWHLPGSWGKCEPTTRRMVECNAHRLIPRTNVVSPVKNMPDLGPSLPSIHPSSIHPSSITSLPFPSLPSSMHAHRRCVSCLVYQKLHARPPPIDPPALIGVRIHAKPTTSEHLRCILPTPCKAT
jgi:hypothetical protein